MTAEPQASRLSDGDQRQLGLRRQRNRRAGCSRIGLRTLPTFMVGFMPLLVFIGSFHNPASVWKIRRIDYACGAMSVVGTLTWLVTRNGILAISAAIVADFMAGVPTLTKSWTHPETETVHTYIGAVISMVIVLLTIENWTFDVAAFPAFIVCMGSVEVVLVGFKPGPRLRARRSDGMFGDPGTERPAPHISTAGDGKA
jgi:hypothetical protein